MMARSSSRWGVAVFWAALYAATSAVSMASSIGFEACQPMSEIYVGNGMCDEAFNTLACGYDGGDCCECTCESTEYNCGSSGYACVDPSAPPCDFTPDDVVVFRSLEESAILKRSSLSPTSSPTGSPTGSPTASPTSSSTSTTVGGGNLASVQGSESDNNSSWGVNGAVIGICAALVLVAVVVFLSKRKRANDDAQYRAFGEYSAGENTGLA